MNAHAASDFGSTGSRVLDDLAEVIGTEAALALAWEFRGQRLYVPQDPDREPRIAAAIGADKARKLCDSFWRTTVAIPMNVALERRVHLLARAGVTKREIARECCIREARVYSILARIAAGKSAADRPANERPVDDRQLPLI